MDINESIGSKTEKHYEIGATVISGLEIFAREECEEKLKCKAEIGRGRIYFKIPGKQIHSIVQLQAVNNLFVLVNKDKEKELDLYGEKELMLQNLKDQMTSLDWTDSLEVWKQFTHSSHYIGLPQKQQDSDHKYDTDKSSAEKDGTDESAADKSVAGKGDTDKSGADKSSTDTGAADIVAADRSGSDKGDADIGAADKDVTIKDSADQKNLPIFRVTCTRSSKEGKKHPFSSQEAACATGGRINDMFGWPVKMKDYDMEVLVDINDRRMVVGIALTAESLHKRNITHFGYTTLQSTIAYCMLRMSCPKDGDVICDPMCGSSAIAIEGANTWDNCHFISGDNVEVATEKSEGNVTALQAKRRKKNKGGLKLDIFQWDVTNLPLRSNSVDVFITDLPFGKRMGSRKNNWELYKEGLIEMARVCKPGTGRAVLLTQDKKCMARVLQMTNHLWRKKYLQFIKMGGLVAGMYSLTRVGRAAQAAEEIYKG